MIETMISDCYKQVHSQLTTQPVRLHADVCVFALEMVRWTGFISGTVGVILISRIAILAVVDAVAQLGLGNALVVGTGEFSLSTGRILTAVLV